MFVSPNKLTHTHAQIRQPGEVCVCARARQQLCVLLQQRTFIKPNKQKHLVCDVMLQCTNQTAQMNRERAVQCCLVFVFISGQNIFIILDVNCFYW